MTSSAGAWLPDGSLFLESSDTPQVRPNRPWNQGDIFIDVPLRREPLALAVPAPVVGEHAKRPRKRRHDGVPVVMIAPGAVDENEGRSALAMLFPIQSDSIDCARGHVQIVQLQMLQRRPTKMARDLKPWRDSRLRR